MNDTEKLLLVATEVRDLLRLIAEPQIAARDEKMRNELAKIVGRSVPKQKAVSLMNGTLSRQNIIKESGVHPGELSTLIKQLIAAKLVSDEGKLAKLVIQIPTNFFEARNTK